MARQRRSGISRRTFLVGAGAAGLAGVTAPQGPSHAGGGATGNAPSTVGCDDRIVYRGGHLRAVAMPLGGIGTGSIALAGDGGMRQWQVVHNVNHLAHVPHSFFAYWEKSGAAFPAARLLQSSALYDESGFKPPATTNDHVVPAESRNLLDLLPGVREVEFAGEYPIAVLRYVDPALTAEVSLEAYSPFIPLNSKDSGLPAIVYDFRVKNPGTARLSASLLATLQNFVGWDGQSTIAGNEHFSYGANRNAPRRSSGLTAIEMTNGRLPQDFAFQGSLALAALGERASFTAQWDNLEQLWRDFSEDGSLDPAESDQPSPEGRTWNAALAVPVELAAGEEARVVFLWAWFFPNRYVNWSQPALTIDDRKSKFWLGTMYANWFKGASEVLEYVSANFTRLASETRLWRNTLYDSSLPAPLLDCASSQSSILRTPTCIWVQDGHLHGFEGCCGASTSHCNNSGCCPLNCTHVWNYEQTLSRLFPELERTMRQTDLEVQQHPAGYIPHRTLLPFYLPRPWERRIGGPEKPALDGMLGTVLKTYREYRQGAGNAWLAQAWPHVQKLMDYILSTLDPQLEGIIRGEQPNTYDISIFGVNSFIGSLYLAALRAGEEMAIVVGDAPSVRRYRQVFDRGYERLPAETWNGEYYVQKVDLQQYAKYQFGSGCHSDQLLGQWWAQQLGLGYVLPRDQVRAALGSMVRYNWRESFEGFKQAPRVFASERDQGLLVCTWPHGGRPDVPTLYSDEVWTGIEYEVAGLLLYEGMVDEALKILRAVRARYDGRERNPWNDIECGDHYARAMSSWALLEAASGQRYSAEEGLLAFAPSIGPESFRCLFVTATGWGSFEQKVSSSLQAVTLACAYGESRLRTLEVALRRRTSSPTVRATLRGETLQAAGRVAGEAIRIDFAQGVVLGRGDSLRVEITRDDHHLPLLNQEFADEFSSEGAT